MTETIGKNAVRHRSAPSRAAWTPRSHKAKSVGEFVPALMRPAFEKFGFPAAAILTEWDAIAGPEFAAFTAPERLKWPRKTPAGDEEMSRSGATLILRVSGARALEVDHLRPQLIERINAAFGYRAVSDIRILQAPIPPTKTVKPVRSQPAFAAVNDDARLADLPDGALKQAFLRMATGLKARQKASETATI